MIGNIFVQSWLFEQPFIFVASKVPFAKLWYEECSCKTVSKYAEAAVCKNNSQKQLPRGVLRDFAKFTGKHLCQSLY